MFSSCFWGWNRVFECIHIYFMHCYYYYYYYYYFHSVFKLGDDTPVFKLGDDPPGPYACVEICILRDVFYEAYYTCLLSYIRNVYNYLSIFYFETHSLFLGMRAWPMFIVIVQVGRIGGDSVFQPVRVWRYIPGMENLRL